MIHSGFSRADGQRPATLDVRGTGLGGWMGEITVLTVYI